MDKSVRVEFGMDLSDGVETVVMVELRPDGTIHVLDEWQLSIPTSAPGAGHE
jgi:hypothetical protein